MPELRRHLAAATLLCIAIFAADVRAQGDAAAPITGAEAEAIRADQAAVVDALQRTTDRLGTLLQITRSRLSPPAEASTGLGPWWAWALGGWNLALTVLLLTRVARRVPETTAAPTPGATAGEEVGVGDDELRDFSYDDEVYVLADEHDEPEAPCVEAGAQPARRAQ